MKRIWILLLFLIPAQVFSVTNLKLNGSGALTITALPAQVVMTCNLAAQGNDAEVEIYFDLENNSTLDFTDELVDFSVITDGIGWIIDPDNRDEDIVGDENGRDGTLKTTIDLENELDFVTNGQFIIKVTDKDGSTATATLTINIPSTPPYIVGKVTERNNGNPIPLAIVSAENTTDQNLSFGSLTDTNGDYTIDVEPGTYEVSAFYTMNMTYKDSDTLTVTVGEGETKTANLQLQPYDGFIDGHVKKEDNTPLANVILIASSTDLEDYNYYIGFTDENGYYKIGVNPGEISISAPTYAQSELSDDLFIEPSADTVTVNQGQTVTVDFTAKQYDTFITGACTVDGSPLSGVEIVGTSMQILMTPPFLILDVYTTTSKPDGTYKMGVNSDSLSVLIGEKEGYELVEPQYGYQSVQTPSGQTTSGYDFEFTGSGSSGASYIAGQVSYQGGGSASDVYVVAINSWTTDREGYLIQYTDAGGNYRFDDLDSGEWKVGVYKSGYHSDPAMTMDYLSSGNAMDNTDFVLIEGEVTDVNDNSGFMAPAAFELDQNYPNPFSINSGVDHTSIRFSLNQQKDVEMSIFNIQGQLVTRVNLGNTPKGTHNIHWDGRDMTGSLVPTGTYFYRIKAGNQVLTKRMTIIR